MPNFQDKYMCPTCPARGWKTPLLIVLGVAVVSPGLQPALSGIAPLALLALGIVLILGWTFAVSLREISRRREAERALAAAREKNAHLKAEHLLTSEQRSELRTAIEGALAGVYIIQDGKFRYVNTTIHEIFGYEKGESVDRLGPEALVHPEDRARVLGNIERHMRGDVDAVHYTFRGLHRDGSTLFCEVRGRGVLYEGKPAVFGTLIDMTAQKQAEQRLVRERELLHALMENIPDTIYFKDANRRFIRVNPAQADLLGIDSPEEAVGKTDFDFSRKNSPSRPTSMTSASLRQVSPSLARSRR